MKLLARFDRIWAVSAASRDELLGFWRWQGVGQPPPVDVLPLGADWEGIPRQTASGVPASPPRIVSIGILEPRKNQRVLLEACEALWVEGSNLELHLVGRVNPHFGKPIATRVAELRARRRSLWHHERMDDAALSALVRPARATAFPSLAEGCGLPLLESLWLGVPCVCSDIPPLVENAAGGGCTLVAGNGREGWKSALRRVAGDDAYQAQLSAQARARALPTWATAAGILREALA